jgi:hypothetical protein
VSYSKVATSVAVFLGEFLQTKFSVILILSRNSFRRCHPHQVHSPSATRPREIPTTIYSLYWTSISHRSAVHHHRTFRLPRCARG